MKSSGSNNDKKSKTISYKDIPYQVILGEILEFYPLSYPDIFSEYVENRITYKEIPLIVIKKFNKMLYTELNWKFGLYPEEIKTRFENALNEFKKYSLLVNIANEHIKDQSSSFRILEEINKLIIQEFGKFDFSKSFINFYGYFKKDLTRKIFPIFKSLTNIYYVDIITKLYDVYRISPILQNNPLFSDYLFIPNGVRHLIFDSKRYSYPKEIPYNKLFRPYFSRFKDLVSLTGFMGTIKKINTLIEILQEHSKKLKKLRLFYKNELLDEITIFEKQLDKLEYLSVHTQPYLTLYPQITFDTDMISKLKTFELSVSLSGVKDLLLSKDIISKLKNCEHLIFENFLISPTHIDEMEKLTKLNELTLIGCKLFTKINKTTVFALLFQLPNIKYLNIIDRYLEIDMNKLRMINKVKIPKNTKLKRVEMYYLRRARIVGRSKEGKSIIDNFKQKLLDRKIELKWLKW
jgi:hypothetical protein